MMMRSVEITGFQLSIVYFYIVRQAIWKPATDSCKRIDRLNWLNNNKTLDTIVIKRRLYAKVSVLQQFWGERRRREEQGV